MATVGVKWLTVLSGAIAIVIQVQLWNFNADKVEKHRSNKRFYVFYSCHVFTF